MTESRHIKAIIFDCFGVLYNDALKDILHQYPHRMQRPESFYHELQRQSDLKEITEDQYYEAVAPTLGMPVAELRTRSRDTSGLDHGVVELIRELKPHYKIGMLSNVEASFQRRFLDNEHLGDLFDIILSSSDVGYVKPQPQIFAAALERLGVGPEEAIFVDDKQSNVEGAVAAGLHGILFTSAAGVRRELERLLK